MWGFWVEWNVRLHTNHSNLVSQFMGSSWANLTSPTVLPRQHNFDGSLKIFRIHQYISLMDYTLYVGLAAHSYGMDLLFTCNCFFYTCNPSHYSRIWFIWFTFSNWLCWISDSEVRIRTQETSGIWEDWCRLRRHFWSSPMCFYGTEKMDLGFITLLLLVEMFVYLSYFLWDGFWFCWECVLF